LLPVILGLIFLAFDSRLWQKTAVKPSNLCLSSKWYAFFSLPAVKAQKEEPDLKV
jgi:hypothetical protein